MTIEFRCSQCNQLLRVPETSAGKNARCPKCSALMQVPAGGSISGAVPPPPPMPTLPPMPGGAETLPSFGPPPPPASGGSNPFSFLDAGGGASAGGTALPPPPKNPFGDGGSSPYGGVGMPSSNPYASPSLTAGGYSGGLPNYGPRSGLPWETKGQRFATWFETMSIILSSPSRAFTQMQQLGGIGAPLMYSIWGLLAPVLAMMLIAIPIILIISIAAGADQNAALGFGLGVGMIVALLVGGVIYVLVVATVGAFISAAIYHVCLLLVGGAKQPYETTFRVVCYVNGALGPIGLLLGFLPYIGAWPT